MDAVPYDDQRVYAMLNAGETEGVFQMESGGMTQAVMGCLLYTSDHSAAHPVYIGRRPPGAFGYRYAAVLYPRSTYKQEMCIRDSFFAAQQGGKLCR